MYTAILWNIDMMLITFLLMAIRCRKENEPMEKWSANDWVGYLAVSFLWPAGIFCLFVDDIWPKLIKERKI